MITLKPYQLRALDSLKDFFKSCSYSQNPPAAFLEIQSRTMPRPLPYIPVNAPGLPPEMPYVCLRVPTGGGKTLMACHAAGLALDEYLRADHTVVLWLVPSNTILDQTADALRDNRHPYRRALEQACGAVEVFTIEEALRMPRAAVEGQTAIIVSTIQCFRVEDTTGRKVYSQNGTFAEHLLNIPQNRLNDLLPGPDGKPVPSLVNMLRLRRPVVIVDEAHNARSALSFATLGQVKPSCIIEFSATPDRKNSPSNILHHVSAAELKEANMVKLPMRVITRHPSQRDDLLGDAITLRADLERFALLESQQTGEYLRPIMLIQAEKVADCEPLRTKLADSYGIPKEQIIISVGALDELPDADTIKSPQCPIRFIITVQKLREGWDCPFAYVLCSLRETRSATAIEQIAGRILRLPNATPKRHPDLNCSYAFSVSDSLAAVLAELRDALEKNGFTRAEADRIVVPASTVQGVLPLGFQPQHVAVAAHEIDLPAMKLEVAGLKGKARLDETTGALTIIVPLDERETRKLAACMKTQEAQAKVVQAVKFIEEAEIAMGGTGKTRIPSPYEQNLDFIVPLLGIKEHGRLFEFEITHLLEQPWHLGEKDATLPDTYNPRLRPAAETGSISVDKTGNTVAVREGSPESTPPDFVTALHQQVFDLGLKDDWTIESLVAWLDRHIDHQDIPCHEAAIFLAKAVNGIMARHGIADAGILALDRFRLRDEIEKLIGLHRDLERRNTFKEFLLPESPVAIDQNLVINFAKMGYEPSSVYDGGHQFSRHYFPKVGELVEKCGNNQQTEEFRCAQFLDTHAKVKFWVRNLVRKPSSFRLLIANGWFYPDFICQLVDGRILVVEYKGGHLYDNDDSRQKREVGAIWAARSQGKCLFAMPKDNDFSRIIP